MLEWQLVLARWYESWQTGPIPIVSQGFSALRLLYWRFYSHCLALNCPLVHVSIVSVRQCSDCSSAVEHTLCDREFVGSNPTRCWLFLFSFLSYRYCILNQVPQWRCSTTNFQIKIEVTLAASGITSLICTDSAKKVSAVILSLVFSLSTWLYKGVWKPKSDQLDWNPRPWSARRRRRDSRAAVVEEPDGGGGERFGGAPRGLWKVEWTVKGSPGYWLQSLKDYFVKKP